MTMTSSHFLLYLNMEGVLLCYLTPLYKKMKTNKKKSTLKTVKEKENNTAK